MDGLACSNLAGLAVVGRSRVGGLGQLRPVCPGGDVEAVFTYGLRKLLDRAAWHGACLSRSRSSVGSAGASGVAFFRRRRDCRRCSRSFCRAASTAHQAIARLRTLVDLINSRHNMFVRIIDAPLMYPVQVAYAAERWRRAHGRAVEALGRNQSERWRRCCRWRLTASSIRAIRFPSFVEGAASFRWRRNLDIRLLPAAGCVRNSVSIGAATRVLLVSGSNMSGKSTLLRAVGINVVLAMAGAPVRARAIAAYLRCTLAPAFGSTIRYRKAVRASMRRLLACGRFSICAAANPPLLFLLDELLQGTNSKDRRIGARGDRARTGRIAAQSGW